MGFKPSNIETLLDADAACSELICCATMMAPATILNIILFERRRDRHKEIFASTGSLPKHFQLQDTGLGQELCPNFQYRCRGPRTWAASNFPEQLILKVLSYRMPVLEAAAEHTEAQCLTLSRHFCG